MADIYEPKPPPRVIKQPHSKNKPLFTTLVTMIVGIAAVIVGLVFLSLGNLAPDFSFSLFLKLVGGGNALLGMLDIYVGFKIWNWKYSVRNLGVIVNIGLIALNLVFFIIGIVGFVLIIISVIALITLDTSS